MARDLSYLNLPDSIVQLAEMTPLEDVALRVLREAMPDVKIQSLIEFDQAEVERFFILVRRIPGWGTWQGDERFIDYGGLAVHVFAKDPNADEVGAIVSEAVRVALRNNARDRVWYADIGGLLNVELVEEPVRKTDWATSSGPVQFADLPAGYQRYEGRYSLWVRLPTYPPNPDPVGA